MLDTLANVKSRLGITTSDDDAFLTSQITLISDVIEAYCRRKFSATNWIQTFYDFKYTYTKQIELYHFPIIQITDLEVDGDALDLSDLRIHKPTARFQKKDGSYFSGEEVVVEYMAGYASVPTPILEVLDSLVGQRYNKKKSGVDLNFGSDVQRVSIPGAISIDFDYTLANNERKSAYGTILGNYANVLDDWRSERAVVGSSKIEYVEEDGAAPIVPVSLIPQSKKEDITLSGTNITNQYVDLEEEIEEDSLDLSVGSVVQYEGIDYVLSTVGGVTRLTFIGGLATGGASELEAGDVLHITYRY
jgi:hypothetical protein